MPIVKICDRCGHREVKAPKPGEFYHEVVMIRFEVMNMGEPGPRWLLCETCERILPGQIHALLPHSDDRG